MSELLPKGPLDIVREMGLEAEELDTLLQSELADDPECFQELQQKAADLNAHHPLVGERVIVYGESLNEDANKILNLRRGGPGSTSAKEQAGIYHGVVVCSVQDAKTFEVVCRLVHGVNYESGTELDPLRNIVHTQYMNYIFATGSEVVPLRPVKAHSLADLRDDKLMGAVDRLILDQDNNRMKQLQALGSFTNKLLCEDEWSEDYMGHQRLSYINSLGLLSGAAVSTRELVHANKDSYIEAGELYFSNQDFLYTVTPEVFEIAPGYNRMPPGGIPLMGGAPEVFISGKLDDDKPAFAPLKDITDIQTLR